MSTTSKPPLADASATPTATVDVSSLDQATTTTLDMEAQGPAIVHSEQEVTSIATNSAVTPSTSEPVASSTASLAPAASQISSLPSDMETNLLITTSFGRSSLVFFPTGSTLHSTPEETTSTQSPFITTLLLPPVAVAPSSVAGSLSSAPGTLVFTVEPSGPILEARAEPSNVVSTNPIPGPKLWFVSPLHPRRARAKSPPTSLGYSSDR